MSMSPCSVALPCAFVLASLAACGDDGPTSPDYEPVLPEQWAVSVTNPWFPLTPGTVWEYTGETDEGTETIRVEVLATPRVVNGVTATVVHDQVFLEGELIEDTFDWYAQDADGNVWYVGEAAEEIEDGVVVSADGSPSRDRRGPSCRQVTDSRPGLPDQG